MDHCYWQQVSADKLAVAAVDMSAAGKFAVAEASDTLTAAADDTLTAAAAQRYCVCQSHC